MNHVGSLFDKKGTLNRDIYKYHPRTSEELKDCIKEELRLQGQDANLNCIDTSKITDMSWLFDDINISIRNINISGWNVGEVKNMKGMFAHCINFNSDLSRWDVGKVRNMGDMFYDCVNFNSDLSHWGVNNVEDMSYMFRGCKNFNSDLSRWDVSGVKDMFFMFCDCVNFNSDLSRWDVSKVINMNYMFFGCISLKETPKWHI